jgi:aspartate aminotransferase
MTGWRIGWMCAPGDRGAFVREAIKLQGQMTNSIASFALPAIVEALTNGAAEVERMRAVFARRAQLIGRLQASIPGLVAPPSSGAFYTFPSVASLLGGRTAGGRVLDSAQAFAEALLDEHAVAIVPGEDFGECARDHVRFSFACSEEQIIKGMERVAAFVAGIRQEIPTVTGTG